MLMAKQGKRPLTERCDCVLLSNGRCLSSSMLVELSMSKLVAKAWASTRRFEAWSSKLVILLSKSACAWSWSLLASTAARSRSSVGTLSILAVHCCRIAAKSVSKVSMAVLTLAQEVYCGGLIPGDWALGVALAGVGDWSVD